MHARQHDGRLERLGQVVDGTQHEAMLFVVGTAHRRGDDHRDVPRLIVEAQLLEHFEAAHARHHDVQQDEIRQRCLPRQLQRARPRIRSADLVAIAQQLAEQRQVLGVVVDDEDGGLRQGVPP